MSGSENTRSGSMSEVGPCGLDTKEGSARPEANTNPATTGNLTRYAEWREKGSEPSLKKVDHHS